MLERGEKTVEMPAVRSVQFASLCPVSPRRTSVLPGASGRRAGLQSCPGV